MVGKNHVIVILCAALGLLSVPLSGSLTVGDSYEDRAQDPRWASSGYFVMADGNPVYEGDIVSQGERSGQDCQIQDAESMVLGGSPGQGGTANVSVSLQMEDDCSVVLTEIETTDNRPASSTNESSSPTPISEPNAR